MTLAARQDSARRPWSAAHADRLYRISKWGAGYYLVNDDGHICVCPTGSKKRAIDLKLLVDDLRKRNIHPPVLIRFMDILADRIKKLARCFNKARNEYGYTADYHPVYPIKVNQQRQVVEAIFKAGIKASLGLEVGSKPELLAVLGMGFAPSHRLIICNGYKDEEFIETALYGSQLGLQVIIVIEKLSELTKTIRVSQRLKIRPIIGIRLKLAGRGEGRWADSAGDCSKFGLRTSELADAIAQLQASELLDCFRLIHFHIGSQISDIGRVKAAMTEVGRLYAELRRLDIAIDYVDVGGGLGIDYDGTTSCNPNSMDYSMQEYANDIVFALRSVCDAEQLPQPEIITESGRALTAHYSMLVTDVIDEARPADVTLPVLDKGASAQLQEMVEICQELTAENARESYHDAVYLRKKALNLFNVGFLRLLERARIEDTYWLIMRRIREIALENRLTHKEFRDLEALLAPTCFLNFSVFQSLPDAWAIDQLFPIVPLQELQRRPDDACTLADITCDSDGRIEHYVCQTSSDEVMPIHRDRDASNYYVGVFLIGAYQEILGDLHNLFGDTHAVHITLDGADGYKVTHFIRGDTVADVLGYLGYQTREMRTRMHRQLERAVVDGRISPEASGYVLDLFEQGLQGYTYLED